MFILKQIELTMQWCNCGVYKLIICCHSEVWNFGNKFSYQILRVKFDMIVIFYCNNITNCWFRTSKCPSYAWYCTKHFIFAQMYIAYQTSKACLSRTSKWPLCSVFVTQLTSSVLSIDAMEFYSVKYTWVPS